MDIGIGTCFSTKKYEYTITERDNLGFFIASVKIRGQLGKIDTGVTVRIVMTRRWQTGQMVAQRHITKNLELQPMNYLRIVADKASWHACGRRRGACGRHCFAS